MSAPSQRWRLLDTGALPAAANIALDATLLELRAADAIPNTLRLLRFEPAAVLVGRHQSVSREVRTDFCRRESIDINRRITGGGAVYFDATQIGWELIAGRSDVGSGVTMASLTREVCEAAAHGLNLLGIPAAFRPRNDIEVHGRKIAGTGGAWEGGAFLFQGTLLVDFDIDTMLRSLRVPVEKLSRHEVESAAERVTCVAELLEPIPPADEIKQALARGFAERLGIAFVSGGLGKAEEALFEKRLQHYASAAWIDDIAETPGGHRCLSGIHQADAGTIRASLAVDMNRERVKSVLFSGDFFVSPGRALYDLESRLRYIQFSALKEEIVRFFNEEPADTLGLAPEDFIAAVDAALGKLSLMGLGLDGSEAEAVTLTGPGVSGGAPAALEKVGAVLLPYCAKLPDCDYRFREGCDECGDCGVGEAFAIARRRGFIPVTVQSFEHLEQVFSLCRADGIRAFIGCCCQAFMVKRHQAFRDAGITGILIDIDDETCYDLDRADAAYAGEFEGATSLRLGILEKLMRHVSDTAGGGIAGKFAQSAVTGREDGR